MMLHNVSAVITAAGLSSRMRVFKPLLPICGSTVIRCSVQKFLDAGCSPVIIVTGRDAEMLKEHLSDLPVIFVHNEKYAESQMFCSVKLGLSEVPAESSAVFFTPCDIPLFKTETLQILCESGKSICAPYNGAHTGHPVMIGAENIKNILSYEGEGGLKGALVSAGGISKIHADDPGAFMDADTPEDYSALLDYSGGEIIPGNDECLRILHENNVPEKVIRHGFAVAKKADELADILEKRGIKLDRSLIRAACVLHDIKKGTEHHAIAGADALLSAGYPRVCKVTASHMELSREQEKTCDETAVVFLADKLVKEDQPVSLEERYFGHITPEKEPYVRQKYEQALRVYKMILSD